MRQLLFVYNANSNFYNLTIDFVHKIISPSTYQCSLCSLTHGNFLIKKEWKNFVHDLPVKTIFFHKDEFEKSYQIDIEVPSVLIKNDSAISELISRAEIDNCNSLTQLKHLVESKLVLHDKHYHSNI